jgi:hypothetical protein
VLRIPVRGCLALDRLRARMSKRVRLSIAAGDSAEASNVDFGLHSASCPDIDPLNAVAETP